MTPIQVILSIALFLIALYAFQQRGGAKLICDCITGAAVVALMFVWWPDLANQVAQAVGVGRGADLITYGLVVIGLGISLNLHIRQRVLMEKITELTRALAIQNAQVPDVQADKAE